MPIVSITKPPSCFAPIDLTCADNAPPLYRCVCQIEGEDRFAGPTHESRNDAVAELAERRKRPMPGWVWRLLRFENGEEHEEPSE